MSYINIQVFTAVVFQLMVVYGVFTEWSLLCLFRRLEKHTATTFRVSEFLQLDAEVIG
jgi:hypothetical protein